MVKINGNEIREPNFTNSFDRRAVQVQNHIIATLGKLGISRDYADVPMQKLAQKKAPASVSWYYEGRNLKYSYSLLPKFVDNLYIIDKVLELEVAKLLKGEITTDQFSRAFSEDDDLPDQLLEARRTLGVEEGETDFEKITKNYKSLAKRYHPDMSEGDHNKFQKINAAHKLIKKELM